MISLIIFCLLTACLSVFLDFCMEKGNIFRGYYNWLTYWLWLPIRHKSHVKKAHAVYSAICGQVSRRPKPLRYKRRLSFLYKPLGGCVNCFGTWVFIVLFFFLHRENTLQLGLFLGLGVNYIWIKIFNKI